MGIGDSKPSPNVRERHCRALYINIPVTEEGISHLVKSPCTPDSYGNTCWISCVIDDLDSLEVYCAGGVYVPSFMKGWMMKLNLPVTCSNLPCDQLSKDMQDVRGYQILTVDFESGMGGSVKSLGARITQRIPSATLSFRMSSGLSGCAIDSPLDHGSQYSAVVSDGSIPKKSLVVLNGTLDTNISEDDRSFFDFIVNRPHKFLNQAQDYRVAYSPETGDGADFSTDGCVKVVIKSLTAAVLDRLGIEESVQMSDAVCFIQPKYILVDHCNTILTNYAS